MVVSRIGVVAAALAVFLPAVPAAATFFAGGPQSPGKVREWPCRIVAQPPLFQVVERAWMMSASFRRQCEALAEKRAVADLRPGASTSGSLALSRITFADDGVVVGRVTVPLADNTIELIAHELEHILERAEGVDLLQESRRSNSAVWKALDGFETQRAINLGRQVAREVRESLRAAR